MAIRPCTIAARHSWVFMKNVIQTSMSITGRSGSITKRGKYACACGAVKFGGSLMPDQLSAADIAKREALIAAMPKAKP